MKRSKQTLLFLVLGTITFMGGVGVYHMMGGEIGRLEWLIVSLVVLFAVIGAIVAKRKMRDESMGLPVEDERSLGIKTRAGAKAFHWSFFVWTYVMLFFSDSEWPSYRIIAVGLVLSIMLYGVFILRESKKGK